MFTVKHISISGAETLHYCTKVTFHPPAGSKSTDVAWDVRHEKPHVTLDSEHDIHLNTLFDGTVFVMNESGATVSRWDLGASPVPLNPQVDAINCTRRAQTTTYREPYDGLASSQA